MSEDLIPFFAIGMPVVLVGIIMVARHKARSRQYAHLERMKALEMGHPPPPSRLAPILASTAIAAGVPTVAIVFGWLSTVTGGGSGEVWKPIMMISLAALASGSIMLYKQLFPGCGSQSTQLTNPPSLKPAYDPDEFDVVGRRG